MSEAQAMDECVACGKNYPVACLKFSIPVVKDLPSGLTCPECYELRVQAFAWEENRRQELSAHTDQPYYCSSCLEGHLLDFMRFVPWKPGVEPALFCVWCLHNKTVSRKKAPLQKKARHEAHRPQTETSVQRTSQLKFEHGRPSSTPTYELILRPCGVSPSTFTMDRQEGATHDEMMVRCHEHRDLRREYGFLGRSAPAYSRHNV